MTAIRLSALLSLILAATAIAPIGASASSRQRSILQDDVRILRSSAEARTAAFDELDRLGVDTIKLTVSWRDIAPGGSRKPQGFDGADPRAYDQDRWSPYDNAIAQAQSRGFEIFLMVAGPAPDWADGGRSSPAGVKKPSARHFGDFVRATGIRYSGTFAQAIADPDPFLILPGRPGTGGALPRVSLWSIWNEPNLPRFLQPQRDSDRARTARSPHIYRSLFYAARSALKATGHDDDTILMGELLPVGRPPTSTKASMRPIEFLRELACLDSRYRPYRGSAAKRRGCSNFRKLDVDGLAYHPYTVSGGPNSRPPHKDDATVGQLGRIVSALDKLAAKRRTTRRKLPVFLTEFGFQTNPPDRFQNPIARVPGYMGEAEYLAYGLSRVASYAQYPLVDDENLSGFQSGLRFADGTAKSEIYDAYRKPMFVKRRGSSSVEVFGGLRSANGGESVQVESRLGSGEYEPLGDPLTLGSGGYFRKTFKVANANQREYRFRLAGETSRTARAASR